LGELTDLTTLNLSGNRLNAVPASVRKLTALTRLDLDHNRLTELPNWLGELTALTTLNLSGNLYSNRLSGLPESFGDLTALTWLDLYGNRLVGGLPASFGNLTALTWLRLGGNQLTEVPDSVRHLTAVSRLDLNNNLISGLPDWLGELTAPRGPQVRIISQPQPAVLDERIDQIRHRLSPRTRLTNPIQIRPNGFSIMAKVPGDRRDRPTPPPQRMRFHIFLPGQHCQPLDAAVTNTATTREIAPTGRLPGWGK